MSRRNIVSVLGRQWPRGALPICGVDRREETGRATCYYLVESARVGGKPRIMSQEYLGTAEELATAMRGGGLGLPDRIHRDFGAVAAGSRCPPEVIFFSRLIAYFPELIPSST